MTSIKINANDGVTQSTMSGGETTVAFDFPIFDKDHIKVYETDSGGTITLRTRNSDYSIGDAQVENQSGGLITLLAGTYPSGATAGNIFTLVQSVPYARTTDFSQAGAFLANTLNKELDLITQQLQQLNTMLTTRAPLLPVDTTITAVTLQDPEDGKVIAWDGTTGNTQNLTN